MAEIKELAIVEPKQASKKFELIANEMSDEQLVEVIEQIDIVTLTQINSQHDISFPSIISELMSAGKDPRHRLSAAAVLGRENQKQRRRAESSILLIF